VAYPASASPTAPSRARADAQQRLAGELCARAMQLSHRGHDQELAATELLSLSGGDLVALELASRRYLALLDRFPDDPGAGRALGLLTAAATRRRSDQTRAPTRCAGSARWWRRVLGRTG
jgi:hypothetical protein